MAQREDPNPEQQDSNKGERGGAECAFLERTAPGSRSDPDAHGPVDDENRQKQQLELRTCRESHAARDGQQDHQRAQQKDDELAEEAEIRGSGHRSASMDENYLARHRPRQTREISRYSLFNQATRAEIHSIDLFALLSVIFS